MRPVTRAELLWTVVLGIVLVGSAFCLVDLHFQMRQLFVAHEHEMDVHRGNGCGYGDARGGAGRTNRLFAGSTPRTRCADDEWGGSEEQG